MHFEYTNLLPQHFDKNSRVWVYQSSRLFSLSEALEIETLLAKFCEEWRSHGADVDAYCNLFFGQFLILMADETKAGVSGCSTDSSVRFVKELGQQFRVDFFNRTSLAFLVKDKIEQLPMSQLQYAFDNGFINSHTLYFNNLVQTKDELENKWIIPIKDSWLANKFQPRVSS